MRKPYSQVKRELEEAVTRARAAYDFAAMGTDTLSELQAAGTRRDAAIAEAVRRFQVEGALVS